MSIDHPVDATISPRCFLSATSRTQLVVSYLSRKHVPHCGSSTYISRTVFDQSRYLSSAGEAEYSPGSIIVRVEPISGAVEGGSSKITVLKKGLWHPRKNFRETPTALPIELTMYRVKSLTSRYQPALV